MKRRLFNTLSALSLVLLICMATIRFTLNSCRLSVRYEALNEPQFFGRQERVLFLDLVNFSDDNVIQISVARATQDYNFLLVEPAQSLNWGHDTDPNMQRIWVSIPFWQLAVVLTTLPGVYVASLLRKRIRRTEGRCRSCGYDLRATPDRCPECGVVPTESGKEVA